MQDKWNDQGSHVRQASPVGSETESLKLRAKANLDLLHERSARTLQLIKSRHANPTVVSDVEKKRLLCKENIQALQAQLATPILASVNRHPPVTRSALRSHSSSDRIPTKGNKHVQFAATADEHFMTVPDVKSTLETHLKARLLKARAPPATTQTKSQRHGTGQEHAQGARALKTGVPVVIAMDQCVVDFANTFNDAALVASGAVTNDPSMRWFPVELLFRRAADKADTAGVVSCRNKAEFYVVLLTAFEPKDFEKYLFGNDMGLPRPTSMYEFIVVNQDHFPSDNDD
ncbi:hypothetical protein DYB37_002853 [Aphanomyces astaci]|uniref:Uncharacterized protein n=1 Tax=Aphanomyces astaci TaxID=112090 RepID=A0A3R7B8J1_APHAT|nr:hypothetical protein DYB35_003000 [Aphanomyces astaci]RHZ31610.1 hypothetical protein DYB37_002853 [Aphanomyces astaci]